MGKLRVAIYDTPDILSRKLAKTLSKNGHDVLFEGKLRADTARPDADVWVARWCFSLKGPFLENHRPKLGVVTMTAGTDHIDLEAIDKLGLRLETCPTSCSVPAAEHAVSLALRGHFDSTLFSSIGDGPLIIDNLAESHAETVVAHMLLRARQIDSSLGRMSEFDYYRHDHPWTNAEVSGSNVLMVGSENPIPEIATILAEGFKVNLYAYDSRDSLADDAMGIARPDTVFVCNDPNPFRDTVDASKLERLGTNLAGKNVTLLGTGRIGSAIGRMMKAFGCNVRGYNRTTRTALGGVEGAVADADFIFIALPLTDETRNILGRRQLSQLKDGTVLVNAGSDKHVDSEALLACLDSGKIRSYGTDAAPDDTRLWIGAQQKGKAKAQPHELTVRFVEHPSVLVTPHEADASSNCMARMVVEVSEKLQMIG